MNTAAPAPADDTNVRLTDILDEIETALRDDRVEVGEIVDALDHRGFAPALVILPIFELTPIGGIPGLPTVLATIVALFAVQIVIGREHVWLPQIVRRRCVTTERVRGAVKTSRPWARKIDRWFRGRLTWLTRTPAIRTAAAICVLLCLTVPPLEIIPFASSIPMVTIALFGLAMLFRDGLMMLLGFIATCLAIPGIVYMGLQAT